MKPKTSDLSLREKKFLSQLAGKGIEASNAGTSLRNMILRLSDQGLTWDEAMGKINNATDKNAASLKLFGMRGATAAIILSENTKEPEMLTTKKDKIINFKIEEKTKKQFEHVCCENFTTPSHELRLFVHSYIKNQKNK